MSRYKEVTVEIIEKLKQIAPKRVFVGNEINNDFSHDEMPIYGKVNPEILIEALTTEEISEIMKICNENLISVTPRGAGTRWSSSN